MPIRMRLTSLVTLCFRAISLSTLASRHTQYIHVEAYWSVNSMEIFILLSMRWHHHGGWERRDRGEQPSGGLACVLNEQLVHDDNGRHGFNDGNSTRDNTRVVTPASSECSWCTIVLCGMLCLRYGRRRLKSDPVLEKNERSIALGMEFYT
jgi:hypothetical protein